MNGLFFINASNLPILLLGGAFLGPYLLAVGLLQVIRPRVFIRCNNYRLQSPRPKSFNDKLTGSNSDESSSRSGARTLVKKSLAKYFRADTRCSVILLQILVCLLLLFIHSCIYWYCSHYISWANFLSSSHTVYTCALFCMTYNYLLSLLLVYPVVGLSQVVIDRLGENGSSDGNVRTINFVIRCGIACFWLSLALPTLLYFVAVSCSDDFGLGLAREMLRVGVALSTVPTSLIALAVSLHTNPGYCGSQSELRLLLGGGLTNGLLNLMAHDELDRLITTALSLRKFEVADWLSTHLLERYEKPLNKERL